MKHYALALLLVICFSVPALAELQTYGQYFNNGQQQQKQQPVQRWNGYENRHETTYPDRELKRNPYTNEWSYQPEDAEPVWNGYEGKWEFPR